MAENPCLPPELERLIFVHAARENCYIVPLLMRVASRVKQWVEPFLYHIIIFNQSPYRFPTPPTRHEMLITHGNSVRHLLLRDSVASSVAWDYLHFCGNLFTLSFVADNLAAHPYPPTGSSWTSLRTHFPNVFPSYPHLTHLQLLTLSSPLRRISWLSDLPMLSHLFVLSPMKNINKSVEQIFARCLQLRMMLWCPWNGTFRDDKGEPTKDQIQAIELEEVEPRLVICKVGFENFTKQFIVHAEGRWNSENLWKLAEEVINKRWETGITSYADIVNYTPS